MFIEEWKDVPGYEGLYQVSSLGRVKKLNYRQTGKERIIKQRVRGKGYMAVSLYNNGQTKDFYVHRLVAEAFIPNPDNLPQVNHKSEVKTDNSVSNLEWCTLLYNINYGTRSKRSATSYKRNQGYAGYKRGQVYAGRSPRKIYQYTVDGCFIKTWESSKEIQKTLGFYFKSIQKCCRGIYKQSHGYKWSYKNIDMI